MCNFLFVEKSKNSQKWPFLSLTGHSGSGSPGIKKFRMVGNQVGLCLIEWQKNWSEILKSQGTYPSEILVCPRRVIFRTGLYRGQTASIPTNLVPKFWASDALQTLLWPLSTISTKKKVIRKKHVFRPLPKTRFSRIKRARQTRATRKNYLRYFLGP